MLALSLDDEEGRRRLPACQKRTIEPAEGLTLDPTGDSGIDSGRELERDSGCAR